MAPHKIENLRDLFIEQGKELYNIALQEERELPELRNQACDTKLKETIDRNIEAARDRRERLEKAFGELNVELEKEVNPNAEAILGQARQMIERSQDWEVRDAAIINSVQKLNHTKIAGLGSLRSYASEIGETVIADTFQNSLQVEKSIDQKLSEIATEAVNRKAVTARAEE